jgi:Uma2 family endonuclease
MSVTTTSPPLSFYGPTPEGFPPPARLGVERYEAMIDSGLFTDDDRFELIEGTLVKKMTKGRGHSAGSVKCRLTIERLLPAGWHVRTEMPVRIPTRESMPEPDVSVARGVADDYLDLDPGPGEVALVVEVSDSTLAGDRALAATYIGGGIPVYWLVNLRDRQVEVYTAAAGTQTPAILAETDTADLVITGTVVGQIAVSDLLPRNVT